MEVFLHVKCILEMNHLNLDDVCLIFSCVMVNEVALLYSTHNMEEQLLDTSEQ